LVNLDEQAVTLIQYAVFPDTLKNFTQIDFPLANLKLIFFT